MIKKHISFCIGQVTSHAKIQCNMDQLFAICFQVLLIHQWNVNHPTRQPDVMSLTREVLAIAWNSPCAFPTPT